MAAVHGKDRDVITVLGGSHALDMLVCDVISSSSSHWSTVTGDYGRGKESVELSRPVHVLLQLSVQT